MIPGGFDTVGRRQNGTDVRDLERWRLSKDGKTSLNGTILGTSGNDIMFASRTVILAAGLTLALAACAQASDAANDEPTTDDAGLALAEAEREAVIAHVSTDTERCSLPEGVERETELVDLGDGVGAVIVTCAVGNRDAWNKVYVVREGGGHLMAAPLLTYDIQGDGQWRADDAAPNVTWLEDQGVFHASWRDVRGCGGATRWRWNADEGRLMLAEHSVQDCEGVEDGQELPDPRIIWPTDPATPEPQAVTD